MGAKEKNKEEGGVMDTPERCKSSQIATSITKFEDSPVFNFLNSLSPIKPVKSIYISQTINALSFTSLPSVFTSPHVTSLRESRFLRRHQLPDPSKPEFSSDDVNNVNTSNLDKQPENLSPRMSDGEVANETSFDCSKFVENFSYATQRVSYSSEVNMVGVSQIDQDKEIEPCDWESLISDASDMLIFESPQDMKNSNEPDTNLFSNIDNMHSLCGEGIEQENLSTQPGEESDLIACPSMDNDGEKIDYEHLSGFHRGMRRRCLVFEMGGAHRKHLQSDGSDPSSNEHQVGPTKTGNNASSSSSRCVLPGIGLHLNALAGTPKDYKTVNHDSSSCGRLLIGQSLSVNFHPSPSSARELLNDILPVGASEREFDDVENGVENMTNDDIIINQSTSPKKKKRRMEQGGEGESSCKRCNCKKSKCLKLYCECFAAGVYCVEPCACIGCFNKPVHEDIVLATRKQIESRNPLAFAPKVVRGSEPISEIGDDSSNTPASARHKRGCNCKKSGCLKKYCECYQGGVGCSINCRCEGCKNAFGRKDGSIEAEAEEDETNRSFQKTPIQGLKNPSLFQGPPPKFDHHLETVREDEIPEFLLEEMSPISGVKLSSPNRKRVSPPHGAGSPGLRSSRKLILKSIPSFPSLTSNQ